MCVKGLGACQMGLALYGTERAGQGGASEPEEAGQQPPIKLLANLVIWLESE